MGGVQVGHNVGTRGGLGAPGGGLWGDRVGFLQTPNALTPSPSSDPTSTSGETEARDRAPPTPSPHAPYGPLPTRAALQSNDLHRPTLGGRGGGGQPPLLPTAPRWDPPELYPRSSTEAVFTVGGGGGGGLSCHVGF